MSHVYVKPGRFKNRNCRYALIGGTVFPSVYDAEEYCAKKGLDVNSCIEAGIPRGLRVQSQTGNVLPKLRSENGWR